MTDRLTLLKQAKNCVSIFDLPFYDSFKRCKECPYHDEPRCAFHLLKDMIALLDGPTPLVFCKEWSYEFYDAWNFETKHFEKVTKEEFEKMKEENTYFFKRFKEEKNKNDENS